MGLIGKLRKKCTKMREKVADKFVTPSGRELELLRYAQTCTYGNNKFDFEYNYQNKTDERNIYLTGVGYISEKEADFICHRRIGERLLTKQKILDYNIKKIGGKTTYPNVTEYMLETKMRKIVFSHKPLEELKWHGAVVSIFLERGSGDNFETKCGTVEENGQKLCVGMAKRKAEFGWIIGGSRETSIDTYYVILDNVVYLTEKGEMLQLLRDNGKFSAVFYKEDKVYEVMGGKSGDFNGLDYSSPKEVAEFFKDICPEASKFMSDYFVGNDTLNTRTNIVNKGRYLTVEDVTSQQQNTRETSVQPLSLNSMQKRRERD